MQRYFGDFELDPERYRLMRAGRLVGSMIVVVGERRNREAAALRGGIELPPSVRTELDAAHQDGNSLVLVGVDAALGGAIELRAAERPEARAVIEGLRARGAKHLAIISGDHEQPTRRLAERLGMDRHFAEVLPQDKAKYLELLQQEGRTVCFIGDGANDSIALKTAKLIGDMSGSSVEPLSAQPRAGASKVNRFRSLT